jgi:hypothetical protein
MPVTTIYKCDKCGKEQNNSNQFWTLTVGCYSYGTYNSPSQQRAIHVCRPCVESFGFLLSYKQETAPETPAPSTVEDLFRQIIALVQEV